MNIDRHHRQSLVLGEINTRRLRRSRVLLLGVGALGCAIADQLVRAGVGEWVIVDRDVVELTNLQRQTLFDESDAMRGLPKVEAAANRLRAIDASVKIEPHAIDVDATNIESLLGGSRTFDLILDGSDNAELRYLVNDVSVKHKVPWVMGGAIGMDGRVAGFKPGGACLRCLFPTPPSPGELDTCDTAGVIAPTIQLAASLQVVEAMKLLVGGPAAAKSLTTFHAWFGRFKTIDLADARRLDCPCCALKRFEFLDSTRVASAKLCGRNAMQVRGPAGQRIDLQSLAARLRPIATVDATALMVKVILNEKPYLALNVFGDGRMIVFGTNDAAVARSIYARVVGV